MKAKRQPATTLFRRRRILGVPLFCLVALSALTWAASCRRTDDGEKAAVEQTIRRYFQVWSDQDIEAYGALFMDDACIQYLDSNDQLATFSLAPFLAIQKEAHDTAEHRHTEVPESIDIRFEEKLARAVVYYKLTAGPKTDYGFDHFTLVKHKGEWRIVNLLFYVTESSG